MWALGILVGMLLANGVIGIKEIDDCLKMIDERKLEEILEFEENQLKVICPVVINYMDCVEDAIEKGIGISMEDLRQMTNPNIKRVATVFDNTRKTFSDLCTPGSDLNEAYTANAECLESADIKTEPCEKSAELAYQAYKRVEYTIQDEVDVYARKDNKICMVTAYQFACLNSQVHELCGQSASELFQTIMKRTTIFPNLICSGENLEELQTEFLDSLQLAEEKRNIYQLAFDLRRRRK